MVIVGKRVHIMLSDDDDSIAGDNIVTGGGFGKF